MTDTWGNLDFYWPSDAILGLDRREKGEPTDEYAIYGILGGLPQKVVTVFFDRYYTGLEREFPDIPKFYKLIIKTLKSNSKNN